MMASFVLLISGMILGWHLSSLYHQRRWTTDIFRRAEALATGVYRLPAPREELHSDQECVREAVMQLPPPQEPVSIKAICLDAHYGQRHRI